ncbi:MAG: dihydrolipoamide acetyltransferase family protein [Nocardioidaceae bacterium]
MPDYKLPDVGEGLTEAEIVSWKVKVGDQVAVNDVVVEIETAKSLVELPSPYAGTVTAIHVAEGETVPVGSPIIGIGSPSAPPSSPSSGSGSDSAPELGLSNLAATGGGELFAPAPSSLPQEPPTLVGYGPRSGKAMRRARRGPAPAATEAAPADVPAVPARVLAKPPVRKLAKDLGIDLALLTGSGPGGSIIRADVEAASADRGMPTTYEDLSTDGRPRPGVAPMMGARETRQPVKGLRKAMAQAMVDSAFTIPHVTEWITVDVTRTTKLVERLRRSKELDGVKVSPLLVLARAVVLAMRRTPEVNASWDEAAQEVVYKGYVNLGIAAATPRGLVVPNIKDADTMSLIELAGAIGDLTATARDGRTQPEDMSGGTFTITNVGVFGVDSGTPIINPGESAILAFGAIRPTPWAVGGKVKVRDVTTLSLSFDHRFIDGALGSRFLADVAAIMEDPASALLY